MTVPTWVSKDDETGIAYLRIRSPVQWATSQSEHVDAEDGPGLGHPLRHLRRVRQHRLGQCRHRPRHLGVRGRDPAQLVGHRRADPLPRREPVADLRRRRRVQRLPGRAWKIELAAFAADTGVHVTVAHLPPGTSKWNKIEHRLFSQITMNWRGWPLKTHQIIVDLIANTTTDTGLTVHAVLDTASYPTGVRYTEKQVAALPLERHDFHGDWNYTLHPADTPKPAPHRFVASP